ncbi:major facilitator superfamily domain-containing protein [Collybia nuda]|uniref:Major facilitator superfamily domain-containing protein n=1 Tax=Collybia nuda TaxID=64659 RepID=A0A9P6CHL5_9AGAR|nr:major facilitator superfamily domain-containing protein [Collybia nuda]
MTDGKVSPSTTCAEGLVAKSLVDLHEPFGKELLDSTLGSAGRTPKRLSCDRPQCYEKSSSSLGEVIYIDFAEGDKQNPANFTRKRKWMMTAIVCFSALIASINAAAYNLGSGSMMRDLNCTQMEATVGFSVYTIGFGVVPLVTASFSEEFGRQPLYISSGIGFIVMYLMTALSRNIQTVIIARLLQGCFGSTGATMVGGTIADLWSPNERGLPMSIFVLSAIGGTGLGPIVAGWIEMNPQLEWRWIEWIQMMLCGFYLVLLPFILKETRSAVLLTRMAKKMRKDTGDNRYRARVEDERESLKQLIYISCTRPIRLLLTEPVVLSFSLWVGFAWGVTFCMISSIPGVFRDLHGFNTGQVGTTYLTIIIGSLIGFVTNMYQETLYQKHFKKRGPEARLHTSCFAAILLPIGMFIYAWSSFSHVHWIVQMLGITIYMWGTFIIYLGVFSYLADCYGPYASSGLAGQSLFRNLTATVFPLFTRQMLHNLGYKWANTLFGFIALIMILFFYGPSIRRRSKFSRAVLESQETS